jgi:membrane-bound serine protease (ClpP class)
MWMKNCLRKPLFILLIFTLCILTAAGEPDKSTKPVIDDAQEPNKVKAAVIVCKGLIDDGLYKSIKRRTQLALDGGADYLIYQIETYGGFLESGDSISKYFILEIGDKTHTVAYITTEAISAGAMIAVSCKDIIMKANTTIGDCAPIQIGAKLEGVEREKAESFVRVTFERAAEANKYPKPLLKAMVSVGTEVYRVKNIKTGEYEFYETEQLPEDEKKYDLKNKELIVKEDELLTLTAAKAAEYGIARAVVKDINEAMEFLAKRDGVEFAGSPEVLETNWSEDMVRWLNSPAVLGILVMLALLGVYVELNTPGVGLPGLVAVICFAIIIGSKFLIGMANWVEVALFIVGILLLLIEIFLIPGFGVAGITGILCIMIGLFGMLIKNPPDRLPWPQTEFDWQWLLHSVLAISLGFAGFVVCAALLAKYMHKMPYLQTMVLLPGVAKKGTEVEISMTTTPEGEQQGVKVGDVGETTSRLRPAGKAKFGQAVVDVVAEGEFIDKGIKVKITEIHGNRVVVRAVGQ